MNLVFSTIAMLRGYMPYKIGYSISSKEMNFMVWLLAFLLSGVVLIISILSLIFTSYKKETPMLTASGSVIAALIAIAQVNIPMPEILPNDEYISPEESIEIRSEWPATSYYVIDSRKDPKSGNKYTSPIQIDHSATVRARSRFLWFWSETENMHYIIHNVAPQSTENISGIEVMFVGGTLYAGNIINRNDLSVTAIYGDGSEVSLNNYSFHQFSAGEGDNLITVTYNDFEATIIVNAKPARLIAIEATCLSSDLLAGTSLKNGQFDVVAIYSDSHEEKVENFTISPDSPLKVGNNRITVSYSGIDTEVIITAKEPVPKSVYIENLPVKASERYTGNQGDSFIKKIGTRNGNTDTTGHTFSHGLEAWIARWNFSAESSWAWAEYQVDGNYSFLEGTISVIDSSYNTGIFNTTIEILGDGVILSSTIITPLTGQIPISVGIAGVNVLRIYVYDNISVEGGTSFALGCTYKK